MNMLSSDNKISRRGLLVGVCVLLALVVLGSYAGVRRWSGARHDRLAVDELKLPLDNALPDAGPAESEKDFRAVISLSPLTKKKTIAKIVYNVESNSKTEVVRDGKVFGEGPFRADNKPQTFLKELVFEAWADPAQARYEERMVMAGDPMLEAVSKNMKSVRWLNEDGRYTEPASNPIKKHYRELDPKFPAGEVAKGSKWQQRIAVDPQINPGGEVVADFEVLRTFERNKQRLVRLGREYVFKAYRPNISKGLTPTQELTTDVMWLRINEVSDVNLETGITEEKSTVQQTYFETVTPKGDQPAYLKLVAGQLGLEGVLSTSRAHEKLARVDHR